MISKCISLVGISCVLGLTACEGGSVGDEDGSSSGGSEESTNTSPTTTVSTTVSTTVTSADSTETDPSTDTDTDTDPTDPDSSTTEPGGCPQDVDFGEIDTSGCAPLSTDYTPGADDDYDACVSDGGDWVLVDSPPNSAARTVAYEDIIALLRNGETPSAEDFTMARTIYATKNGIESRVLRREDLHYPPVDEADQDPKVLPDRQCTIGTNADDYPDRCVGPAKIQPIVDAAFAAGETGDGDANVHAARIDAALQWFSFVSVYKESASCGFAPADCDSHWAYYNGAVPNDQSIGIAANFREIDPAIDDAIFNGMLGIRCWRGLYPA
ncbi:MAG: hypothetical protein IAG13_12395, partial [Deltaproteobacteria bacterium]|nr:hypothetical protein [Nannocystaceae bacterium]